MISSRNKVQATFFSTFKCAVLAMLISALLVGSAQSQTPKRLQLRVENPSPRVGELGHSKEGGIRTP
jgi:hypothetical protein